MQTVPKKSASSSSLPKVTGKKISEKPDPKKRSNLSDASGEKKSSSSHDSSVDKSKSTKQYTSKFSSSSHSSSNTSSHTTQHPHSTTHNSHISSSSHHISGNNSTSTIASNLHPSSSLESLSVSTTTSSLPDLPPTSSTSDLPDATDSILHGSNLIISPPIPMNLTWEMVDGVLTFHQKPKPSDFKMFQIIGSGTFGIVQVAQHKESRVYVAMKILEKQRICDLRQAEHIKYEREILHKSKHPRIIRLYESMQDEKYLYLITELCTGGDFLTLRQERGSFKPSVVRYYAAQLVTALQFLHDNHIAYRDLKPENLLMDSNGQLKLTDFGFAKELNDLSFTLCGTAV